MCCIMEPENNQDASQIPFARRPVRSFNEIVCQAIDETLNEFVGPRVTKAVYMHLKYKFGVDRNELPYRIDTICLILERTFGVKGAHAIERKAAKNFYGRILLPFNDQLGVTLEDFLKAAKETVASRDNYYV